jgi:hypothetical protein
MSTDWLLANAPGFKDLSVTEREAISTLPLLWSFFEDRILRNSGNANSICAAVDLWLQTGTLRAGLFDPDLAYFRHRYFAGGHLTDSYHQLKLRSPDKPDLVCAVVNGTKNNPRDRLAALLIIVLRLRNNLLHGMKWPYGLAGQRENFSHANAVLMKVLECYGQLPHL